ncbi:phosphate ABC transporter substrate-binding protein PstS [Micromonospora sp. NBC_00898]|uniref:phosphate ABC transporter substrate-binding protein PstS n=1 Tax=Micromonospora sp. NBC_00898 TaxID=2975981 RepID=UPI0038674553|nr:phosphate ABC transporter substrate-binding protein PstS [Micromonospora sp. NBC_00898]
MTQRVVLSGLTMVLLLAAGGCPADDRAEGVAPGITCARGTLNGQGSSSQANAMTIWTDRYEQACRGATINYEPSGSGAGINSFLAGTADFAGTDSPLKGGEREQADARCSGDQTLSLPMVVGPVAVAYHLAGVPALRLTPATVAAIFATRIRRWDDPAIRADNPGVALPPTKIRPVHRSDSSGTTDSFTDFLVASAPDAWNYGRSREWAAPGGVGVAGSARVLEAVRGRDGAVGYLELSYLRGTDLPAASIRNASGRFVAPSGGAAVQSLSEPTANLLVPIEPTSRRPGAYPLVLVTYEVVCAHALAADKKALVRSFLGYTASEEGQRAAGEMGYAPLPAPLDRSVRDMVERIS